MRRALLDWLRRHSWVLASASCVMAAPAGAQFLPGGRGGTSTGTSSALSAENPWAGTAVFVVDDTYLWMHDNMIDSLQVVNADSGLTGTVWEINWNFGVNTGIGSDTSDNGVAGFRGQAASTGCGGYDCRMTLDQIKACYDTGLFEVCSHGGRHLSFDEYSAQAEFSRAFGAADTNAMEWCMADPYYVMLDSLGITLHSMVTPFHRWSDQASVMAAKYYRNVRSGGVWNVGSAKSQGDSLVFPPHSSGGPTNVSRGSTLQLNRNNVDPMSYWWSGYDKRAHDVWSPMYRGNRMWVPHVAGIFASTDSAAAYFFSNINSAAAVTSNLANIKWVLTYLAETKGSGVFTFHDQNRTTPNITPDLYDQSVNGSASFSGNELGMVGVMQILRYAAHYARNGLLGRDGPKLQVMKFDDAMNKRVDLAHLAGPVNIHDNPFMRPDSCGTDHPYGFPSRLFVAGGALADSGWRYFTPDAVMANGGWFGYDCEDNPSLATATDSAYTTGIFADTTSSGNFKGLIMVAPVIPNSRARISLYASASHVYTGGGSATPNDSLSACYINIVAIPMMFNQDPTDTTEAWVQGSYTAWSGDSGFQRSQNVIPPFTYYTNAADWTGGASLPDSVAYCLERNLPRFHMRDGWNTMRGAGYTNTVYSDSTSVTGFPGRVTIKSANDRGQRWRQFTLDVDIPPMMNALKWIAQPVGWAAASACSLAITKVEVQCTPR